MRNRVAPAFLCAAALATALASSAVRADEGCGGIKLQGGQVQLGQRLAPDSVATEAGKRCLAALVAELGRNRLLRAVVVANRVTDAQNRSGQALAAARQVADALVAAGLPKGRVFAVAPRADSDASAGLVLRYTERAPDNVVARLLSLSGQVRVGGDPAALRPAEPMMPLLVDDVVETGSDGQALIGLQDGSGIRLGRGAQVKLARLGFESGARSVRVEVARGQIETEVRKAGEGSAFEASSRVAVASVRGTVFRFGADAAGPSRLETLEGRVGLGSATDPAAAAVEVPAGQGARVLADGKVEPPQPLPAAPVVLGPLRGPLPSPAILSFAPVAGAVSYRVELARDPDFLVDASELTVSETRLELATPPAPGKWYFRITAVSAAGFAGAPSKVYAFVVTP